MTSRGCNKWVAFGGRQRIILTETNSSQVNRRHGANHVKKDSEKFSRNLHIVFDRQVQCFNHIMAVVTVQD